MAATPLSLVQTEASAILTDGGLLLSHAELMARAQAWVRGIPPRSVVMVLTTRRLEAMVGVLACLTGDLVLLPVDAGMAPSRILRLRQLYRPDFLWRPDGASGYVLEDLRHERGCRPDPHPDLALLLSTSGSTGAPKMVRLSGVNLRANAAHLASCLDLVAADRYISTLPLDHTYGLSLTLAVLQAGGSVLVTEKTPVQREFWDFFVAAGVTVTGGVPHFYEILRRLGVFRRKLPSLRVLSVAGGRLPDELQRELAAYAGREGKALILMYGQTEATALMAALPSAWAADKIGSIGRAFGGSLTLVDERGEPVTESGKVGEIAFEGAGVSLGTAESGEDLSRGDERHGRLLSGDLARVDGDGFLYLVGRRSRFLKLHGNRVDLDAVEEMVCQAFPFLECACIGSDEKLRAFVAGRADVSAEVVLRYLSDETGLSASLFDIVPRPFLPRTATGKIAYSELS